jgi:hypothetical protein
MADAFVKIKVAGFRVNPEQYRDIERCAKSCGLRVSVWMRLILLQAATQKPHKGYLRIKEPNGVMA